MNKIVVQLMEKRGITEDFLYPKYENLADPDEMPDMEKAVSRIKKAAESSEKILIYGDYDVDGVTATAVMLDALELAGVNRKKIKTMLPDRFVDGYGMSPRVVSYVKENGIGLVITVDCGSRNHEIVKELKELGADVIITDHHECDEELPEAVAVVNAKRKDFGGAESLRELAGVGVAFKVAQGLVKAGMIKDGQEKWLLDLVLLGTICDSMKLVGENRILGYYGMKVLIKTRRLGLAELMRMVKMKKITTEAIGFQLGPRLNAAGRLETAELSLKLLTTKERTEAAAVAEALGILNKKRRDSQQAAMAEIAESGIDDDPVIVVAGDWHEGVIGIVAGRLVEGHQRPAFVLTEVDGGILKGSGRSFGEFNLAEALKAVGDVIVGGGGHAAAAGVKLEKEKLPEFKRRINEYYKSLRLADQGRFLLQNAELDVMNLADFSLELVDDLALLEPFGNGNEMPLFCLKNMHVGEVKRMGADMNHLRITVQDDDRRELKCVAFFAPEKWFAVDTETMHDFVVQPIGNEFNGVRSIEARLIDIL